MLNILKKYFGYNEFKPFQEDIIKEVVNNKDVLVLMPAGGGKSLCYQLPAVIQPGVTIVISPLISLMKDQVDKLNAIGIPAVAYNSSVDYKEMAIIKHKLTTGQIKLLYVAPERITLPGFFEFLRTLDINLIAIDEAHCISEWGHDFRPEYRNLYKLKQNFPLIPIIALTATAITHVQDDIIRHLGMRNPKIFKASLDRTNLFYTIKPKIDMLEMYKNIEQYIRTYTNDSGIIYCQSRKSVEDLAAKLQKDGIRALPYHAGLNPIVKTKNQDLFINGDVKVIVATIAFGMGINKSNVRYVIHCDMPKSMEAYYQETGRAGRDGLPSDCILFFNFADKHKYEYFIKQIENDGQKQIADVKLMEMVNYCTENSCRRANLLDYFEEEYNKENCCMCDVCVPRELKLN